MTFTSMTFTLWSDHDTKDDVLLCVLEAEDLEDAQLQAEEYLEAWDEEFEEWDSDEPFMSEVLPGLCEGDDVSIRDEDGVDMFCYWTGEDELNPTSPWEMI